MLTSGGAAHPVTHMARAGVGVRAAPHCLPPAPWPALLGATSMSSVSFSPHGRRFSSFQCTSVGFFANRVRIEGPTLRGYDVDLLLGSEGGGSRPVS